MTSSQPPPLPVHLINLTLQYLLPPTAPLPVHLLSKDLLQRHHFLSISPDDTEAYFCWPTLPSSSASIIRDLELRAGNESLLEKHTHDISYEHEPSYDGDEENDAEGGGTRARVRIADDLDLYVVFVWQNADEPGSGGESGWRYNDIKRLPDVVSNPAHISDADAVALEKELIAPALSINTHHEQEHHHRMTRSSSPASEHDSYWDNYGAGSSSHSPLTHNHSLPHSRHSTHETDEAAYWGSYSAVQGTADSTIPSRVPSSRKLDSMSMHPEEIPGGLGFEPEYVPGNANLNPYEARIGAAGADVAVAGGWAFVEPEDEHLPPSNPAAAQNADLRARAETITSHPQPTSSSMDASQTATQARGHSVDPRILHALAPQPSLEESRKRAQEESMDARNAEALVKALFPVVAYQDHRERVAAEASAVAGAGVELNDAEGNGGADVGGDLEEASASSATPPGNSGNLTGAGVGKGDGSPVAAKAEIPQGEREDEAVKEALRGVYKLWLGTQRGTDHGQNSKEAFVALVGGAISDI